VPRLGRADEVVVRDIEVAAHLPEMRGGLFREHLGLHARFLGGTLDLLPVLVRAGHEEHVVAQQPARPSDRVREHRRVGVADVRAGVDVVDRGRDVERIHRSR